MQGDRDRKEGSWALIRPALVALFALVTVACTSTDTTPTPPTPPPPVAPAPSITCGETIAATAANNDGARVTYSLPENHGGEGAVTVNCTPPSGEVFPIGTTQVECKITDALNRSASCSFAVN